MSDQEYVITTQMVKIQELSARLEVAYSALKEADRVLLYAKTIIEFTDGVSSNPTRRIDEAMSRVQDALDALRGKTRGAA